ncbi:unnamed protein product [marine sediment metagenome]|uniref:Uncharacterized protein n=1 Tax=marine sediment metagenome TaxID=412755 RepID=X1B1L4_9ZZZZ
MLLVKNKHAFNSAGYPSIPGGVQILEWGGGKLSNGGDEILIGMPGDIDGGVRQYIRIDSVEYDDNPPWPIEPDGTGPSLTRIFINAYANDPNNWQAALPTPGQ